MKYRVTSRRNNASAVIEADDPFDAIRRWLRPLPVPDLVPAPAYYGPDHYYRKGDPFEAYHVYHVEEAQVPS